MVDFLEQKGKNARFVGPWFLFYLYIASCKNEKLFKFENIEQRISDYGEPLTKSFTSGWICW